MSASKTSDGGVVTRDPYASYTLKASDGETNTSAVAEDAATGFGAMKEIIFELALTSISVTGGATVKLEVWVQRLLADGETWDDLLCFQIAGLTDAAAAVRHVAEYNSALGSAPTPAAVQDAGGSPPFSQRGTQISDSLRAKHRIQDTSGTSTARELTWALIAKGRP